MGIFFALILGIIAFSGINENSQKNQEKILTTETEINKNKSSTKLVNLKQSKKR